MGKRATCHGLSQSSGIGQAPSQAPITAPCAGIQIIYSKDLFGLKVYRFNSKLKLAHRFVLNYNISFLNCS